MSARLASFGAWLMVCASACANIWEFSDLQAPPDASTFREQDSSEDFAFPPVRTDAFAGADSADSRVGDAVLDTFDGGHSDVVAADVSSAGAECPTTFCSGAASSGACVDTDTDPANCGSCGNACARGATCLAGACKCPAAQATTCSGVCVDLTSDHGNCGGCGNACPAAYQCSNRSCVPCQSTDKMCGGICVDVGTDINNCNSCGVQCPSGATCVSGTCTCPTTDPSVCPGTLDGGQQCVSLAIDHNNCGGCGNVCTLAHAASVCASSTCAISACVAGYVDCNQLASDGCEINTTNDSNNCGGCGSICNLPNASASCTGSSCAIGSCSPGHADCDTLASTGCEVNTAIDPSNCGGCGAVCSLPHATAACKSGMCTIASCNAGFADCDGNPMNGCETDLSQPAHCGTCSSACASRMLCSAGSCVSVCSGNTATLCNSYCANTTTDVNNCGGCGVVCSLPNASAACTSSHCAITSCASGYAHCNADADAGCEVNTTRDINNCGACGTKCTAPANAVATCSGSPPTCGFSCNPSYTLCTSTMTCVDIHGDPNNCGSCGTKCPNGGDCNGGCGKHSKGGG